MTCCSRSTVVLWSIRELARESRWATVGFVSQVFVRTGTKGAFTINYMRAGCRLMLKDMAAARASVHAKHENLQEGRNGHLLSHFRQQVSNQAADLCGFHAAWA